MDLYSEGDKFFTLRKEVKMNTTIGIQNEEKFCEQINNKTFDELNTNLQYFMYYLFHQLDKKKKFNCFQTENFIKPDICISQENELRFVSLKYGQSETLHNESIKTFVNFLKDNGISDETVETYLLYHYGDGTIDGTGQHRLSSVEVRFKYDDRIKKMNEEFNNSKEFIKKFAERVMFQGVNPDANKAGFIYHGDPDYGVFVSRYQFMRHIERKNWNYMETCVHIGPFVIRPHSRYANKEIRSEESRHLVVVNYPRFVQDLMYISSRYSYAFNPSKTQQFK